MKQTIGIIGASGDLGGQLLRELRKRGFTILSFSRSSPDSSLKKMADQSHIIHVCAPLLALKDLPLTSATIVLHDSVMNSSREASKKYLAGRGAIVHMLMNQERKVIIASDAPHSDEISKHFNQLEFDPHLLTIDEHDELLARTQAPLALLCKTLLPYLNAQDEKGMLTPSGQLLTETLRSRDLVWTDATIHSILKNPQLYGLLNEMKELLNEHTRV